MALRKRNQVYTVTGSSEIALEAKADESFMVKSVYILGPTGTSITLRTGRTSVGFFRTSGALGNHLFFPPGGADAQVLENQNILSLGFSQGWFRGYPVPAGYTFSGSGPATSDCVQSVLYDEYDPGDVTASMPNGPDSVELDYISYGNTGGAISTAATTNLDTQVNDSEFAAFPFGAVVPSNSEISWHCILASSFAPSENDGSDDLATQYLKITRDREVLFDKDRNGLPYYQALGAQSADAISQGAALGGNQSDTDDRSPFILPEALSFSGGQNVAVEWTTHIAGSAQNFNTADQEVGFFSTIVRGS